MKYNIVAGEELRKIMINLLDNPIPFNEDMSIGDYHNEPFGESFINERSAVHHVTTLEYKEKLSMFLNVINTITYSDEINLYFGDDKTCVANWNFLIKYFANRVKAIKLHIVNEYTGEEIESFDLSNK